MAAVGPNIKKIAFIFAALLAVGLFLIRTFTLQDASSFVLARMKECYRNQGAHSCYLKAAEAMRGRFAIPEILDVFRDEEIRPEISLRCHEASHYLGRLAYADARDLGAAFNECRAACQSGCYHGVVEGMVKERGMPLLYADNSAGEIAALCGKADDHPYPLLHHVCIHGLGHGFMFITSMDLPASLRLCDLLPADDQIQSCYSGVFMENSTSSTGGDHPATYLRDSDPFFPCPILEKKYQDICYAYQAMRVAEKSGWDWKQGFSFCHGIPAAFRWTCFSMLGFNQIQTGREKSTMVSTCVLAGDAEHRRACIAGIISSYGYYVGVWQHLLEICAIVQPDTKAACYQTMRQVLIGWGFDEARRKEVCAVITDRDQRNLCEE